MDAFDAEEADFLRQWRPELRGDERTCDIQWLYKRLIPTFGPAPRVAEIGTSWGRSVIFAAAVFCENGLHTGELWAFDPVLGPGNPARGFSSMRYSQAAASWVANATTAELDLIRFCRLASPLAACLFPDNHFDLVFIDGNHEASAFQADLAAWFGKVKPGGVLAGHDYTTEHPGVMVGVREAFGRNAARLGTCWAVRLDKVSRVSPRVDVLGRR